MAVTAASTYVMSAAPDSDCGVPTPMKWTWAPLMAEKS